ncbi:EF-hand domain-containing protein [Streptomyces parvus]|uniref:EF-hand domain-containing protein n=1 Tax=Streptomyces parvus TaxID=66428 RepID=UPI0033D82236
MRTSLTEQEISDYREAFSLCDKDNDGKITADELGAVLTSLGHTPTTATLQEMLREADTDEDRKLDWPDFLTIVGRDLDMRSNDDDLLEAFRTFDKDGSGCISTSEWRTAMQSHGEKQTDEEISELLREGDVDGDGQINYEEFIKTMRTP